MTMIESQWPWVHRPWECLPLPTALLRLSVLVVVLVFVLLLLQRGYDPLTCLLLASGTGMLAVQIGQQMARLA
jgi:hypothetical protein